jgi:hypothetical protein
MSVTQIANPLPGEDLIGIQPQLLEQVNPGWLHRLNLFNGRALTAPALQSEQAYRAGRLAILGQCVTHGVVKGLELSADLTQTDPVLQITPGYGIAATGEDVTLQRTLKTTLGSLQVIDPALGSVIAPFPAYAANVANTTFAGVLLLQPITGQVSGAAIDSGALPEIVSGNLNTSCDQDPEEFAFEDWQIVDGVRLVLVAWPALPTTLTLPAMTPAVSWRNRLVYTVFNAELALAQDDFLPWDMLGVPVGLVGFDNTWKVQFVDRSAVVRAGGLPRTRYVLPPTLGSSGAPLLVQPALAQARVSQLSEQIGATPTLKSFVPGFTLLPPCGVLPASSMDFVKDIALWLPSTWDVSAAPVLMEEVETALLSAMTAQPLDVTQPESVEVLVPLPDSVYDPKVLVVEQLDPAFQAAVTAAQAELATALQKRKTIELEANTLSKVVTGSAPGPLYNLDAGLTSQEIALRDAVVYVPAANETFGTVSDGAGGFTSVDLNGLIAASKQAPYTLTTDGNGNPLTTPLTLFSQDDMNDLATNGIQHFIDRINGKLSKADDLLDLAFLTSQSDIYRFRQYVLGATAATALAVSPIAAEIATGESAASTAANLQNYLSTILPTKSATLGVVTAQNTFAQEVPLKGATVSPLINNISQLKFSPTLLKSATTISRTTNVFTSALKGAAALSAVNASSAVFTPVTPGSVDTPASTSDVLAQSPIVGAQLNLRTLSIAQRLANPPSQEGVFYAVGNRVALLNLLADLEITIDDIPILVDNPPPPPGATTTTSFSPPSPPTVFPFPTLASLRAGADANYQQLVLGAVLSPNIPAANQSDPDEASLFSTGIKVLEQHSSLLRAIEARIQQYRDFLTLSTAALTNIQTDLPQAQTLLTQLNNNMAQGRGDLAFTTALLNDEIARIARVNAQRASTLANYVQIVAFMRPRTIKTEADVPTRQLVPGNIANPVPSCLQQTQSIPPELREVVALLREAPVNWMPSVQALLNKLQTPSLLIDFAFDAQARATMVLSQPARISSASLGTGVYAPVISNIFSFNQTAMRSYVADRATFQPAQYAAQSWAAQLGVLRNVVAIGDLVSSSAVHAEVVNATSRIVSQVSSVATCLYARANQAEPIDRLAWAEFLRGPGLNVQMQSLAILPSWNTLDYVFRQQMQMLADWLFLQIDSTNSAAVGFMSDVVRVAILLASDAPVDNVIEGAVALTATPKVGGVLNLTLPSQRVQQGMYVQLYSAGVLTAQAVVSDLDSASVRATVTTVYQPGVALQANDVAHFTTQAPVAVALRAFDR